MTKLNKRRTINEFVNKRSFVIFWDLAFFICKIVDLKTARCNSAVQKKEKGTLMGGRDRKLELSVFVFANLLFESLADIARMKSTIF